MSNLYFEKQPPHTQSWIFNNGMSQSVLVEIKDQIINNTQFISKKKNFIEKINNPNYNWYLRTTKRFFKSPSKHAFVR